MNFFVDTNIRSTSSSTCATLLAIVINPHSHWRNRIKWFEEAAIRATVWTKTFCAKDINSCKTTNEKKYSIFAINDYIARAVYTAAEVRGLKIGEDIFVSSFGDLPLCEKLTVPLTSVSQSNAKVGYEAANLLYYDFVAINCAPIHHVIPVNLHIRASSTGVVSKWSLKFPNHTKIEM